MAYVYDVQEVFRDARSALKNCFGLELTLIELVLLRHEAADSIRRLPENPMSKDIFHPYMDAVVAFLDKFYGIESGYAPVIDNLDRLCTDEPFRQYLRIIQEKSHMPWVR